MKNIVEVKSLSKTIRKKQGWFKTERELILKDISFSIQENEFVVILGKNGSGKSTLLKCLSGIIYAERGRIFVDGQNPFKNRNVTLKKIGIIFGQKSLLFQDLEAIDYLKLLQKTYDLTDEVFENSVNMIDSFMPCRDLLSKPVRGMSYGEKMKVELLSIILHRPKILILDEPFVGLDPHSQNKLLEFLIFYKKEYEATILLTTHQLLDVLKFADRTIVMKDGGVVYDGNVNNLVAPYFEKKLIQIKWASRSSKELTIPFYGISIIKDDYKETLLEVETNQCSIQQVIVFMVKLGEIMDIEIKSMSMDKVVEAIYEESKTIHTTVS